MNEVFLSYNHDNRVLAGRVKQRLEKLGFAAFLAHEDIEVSEKWRSEILKHLDSCSGMLAIVTENFSKSAWTNQEVGFLMGRNKPIVSLAFGIPTKSLPGLLEELQAIPDVSEASLEAALDKAAKFLETWKKPDSDSYFTQRSKEIYFHDWRR